jgi:hypothetical protein
MESTMGMAIALTAINELGCRGSLSTSAGDGGYCGSAPGSGPYVVPPEATCDPSARIPACTDFVFDIQTYCFDAGEWRTRNVQYPTVLDLIARCDAGNPLDCFDPRHYAEGMFLGSDTTMTVITGWPASGCFPERQLLNNVALGCGLPLSNAGMRALRDWINEGAMSQRCINHCIVMPNDFLERQIEQMVAAVSDPSWRCAGWTTYPGWTSDTYPSPQGYAQGFFMTDPIGLAFIEAGLKLGVPNFAIHKGIPSPGFNVVNSQPWDIGPVAKMFPQANFIVYGSAIQAGIGMSVTSLGPPPTESVPYPGYSPANTPTDPTAVPDPSPLRGVNQLIQSLIASGVIANPDIGEPSKPHNVYAEMGGAWSQVMNDTNQAQHYMGKLLKYLGPSNICWGTRAILEGSPQSQIDAFRAFTITPQYQEKYGYSALTPAIKAQIFGLNAARIYRVDACAPRCAVNGTSFA